MLYTKIYIETILLVQQNSLNEIQIFLKGLVHKAINLQNIFPQNNHYNYHHSFHPHTNFHKNYF